METNNSTDKPPALSLDQVFVKKAEHSLESKQRIRLTPLSDGLQNPWH